MASSSYSDEKAESAGGKKINLDSRGTSFSRLACGQDLCPRRGWMILPARFGPSGREKVCRSGGARGVHGIAFSSRLAGANSGEPSLQLLENLRISAEARLEAHLRLNRGVCHAESENFIEFKCLVPQIIHLNRKIASSVALCAPKLTEMINPNLAPPLPNSKREKKNRGKSKPLLLTSSTQDLGLLTKPRVKVWSRVRVWPRVRVWDNLIGWRLG